MVVAPVGVDLADESVEQCCSFGLASFAGVVG